MINGFLAQEEIALTTNVRHSGRCVYCERLKGLLKVLLPRSCKRRLWLSSKQLFCLSAKTTVGSTVRSLTDPHSSGSLGRRFSLSVRTREYFLFQTKPETIKSKEQFKRYGRQTILVSKVTKTFFFKIARTDRVTVTNSVRLKNRCRYV